MSYRVEPQDYLPELANETKEVSAQEQADFNQKVAFENTANDLAARKNRISDVGVGTDEVVSLGKAKAEARLQAVQQELFHCTDPTQSSILQVEAQQLAEMLTTGGSVHSSNEKAPEPNEEVEEDECITNALISQYGKERVDETLSWASQSLGESTSRALNTAFEGEEASLAFSTLDTLKSNPDLIQSEHTAFNELEASQLIEQFGEHGSDLVTLNTMLSEGKISKGDVLSQIMSSSELMRTAYQAAQAGLMKFSV
ncbi:hypothetical protein SynSYN20_01741 [Synechococcus sp. SYN20]|uniref:hypothetical protein n=1 Tax=Synechococcus sp. SYN20 TaxID=1050714 RepID=UPI0016484EED|nr:hypothetical protein [Synechococcus sp. SYN20]QNJ26067.1 hypothetical protein SynSYN20_01741 [Synechococcus sp. SYN20]